MSEAMQEAIATVLEVALFAILYGILVFQFVT